MISAREGFVATQTQPITKAPPAPPLPTGFNPETLFQGIHWHQRWEVFQGVFTPGGNDIAQLCDIVQLPADLTGKRVLDVGAWHGCVSFECERRGASEVVALSLEDPKETGFYRLKEALGSKVQYVTGSAYSLSPKELGTFDVVLFLGVLYHLRYPLLAIDRLRTVARDTVYVETHAIDDHSWLRGKLGFLGRLLGIDAILRATPIWRQYREFELHPGDQSNWFGPNVVAVLEAFQAAGFNIAHTKTWEHRAGFQAKVCPIPERMLKYTYEACASNSELVGLQHTAYSGQ